MKVPKIIEAAKAMALENLVPPEITVITRDKSGHMQLWWMPSQSYEPESLGMRAHDLLSLSKDGHWLVPRGMENRIKTKSLGYDALSNQPFCRRYSVLDRRMASNFANMDEKEFTNSSFVSGLLKKIFDGPQVQECEVVSSVIGDKYIMKTIYRVDGVDFEDIKQAEDFIKGAKLFDVICENEPDADFLMYQTAIETLLKNSDKVINILKGK